MSPSRTASELANEARALRILAETDVPAPRLHALDLEGTVSGEPALVQTRLEGAPCWHPEVMETYLARTAEVLVAIHAVTPAEPESLPSYAPYYDWTTLAEMRPVAVGPVWDRVLSALDRPWPAFPRTFIHRDYHPGNILWDGDRVTGVVDWATAGIGPPGVDLARMRQNLAIHHGHEVGDRFVSAYVRAGGNPSARDPFWDLLDAADMAADLVDATPDEASRFECYVTGLLAELESMAR